MLRIEDNKELTHLCVYRRREAPEVLCVRQCRLALQLLLRQLVLHDFRVRHEPDSNGSHSNANKEDMGVFLTQALVQEEPDKRRHGGHRHLLHLSPPPVW